MAGEPLSDLQVGELASILKLDMILDGMVVKDSHPGAPLGALGGSNGIIISEYRSFLIRCVVERICLLLSIPICELELLSGFELVQRGLCDPIRAFIKGEPHSDKKVAEGRFRIISGVSLVDNIIERVMFRNTHAVEIANWRKLPTCPGMSLEDYDLEFIYEWQVKNRAGHGDVAGWDWCLPRWLMEDCTKARLLSVDSNQSYKDLVRAQFVCWVRGTFLVGNELWEQTRDGVQKSGSYRTSRDNSWSNYILNQVAAIEAGHDEEVEVKAMGDDLLAQILEGVREELERLGFRVKVMQDDGPGNFEFCSQVWSGDPMAEPQNLGKMLYRLLSKIPGSALWYQTLQSLHRDLRHHPQAENVFARLSEYVAQELGGATN